MNVETRNYLNILKYLSSQNERVISLSGGDWEFISKGRVYYFEKPDIVLEFQNVLYAIEHFEFDSTLEIFKNNQSKGSELKIKEQEFIKKYLITPNPILSNLKKPVAFNNSYQNYKKNFLAHYEKHALKINGYLDNIRNVLGNTKHIKFGFWVEDVYPFGTYVKENDVIEQIVPIMDAEIFDKCKSNTLVDFYMFTTLGVDGKPVLYLVNTHELSKNIVKNIQESNFFNHSIKHLINTIKIK